jgi:hypothetical protein
MLNELAKVRDSLERYGVDYGGTHPWVKRLGRAPTLVVGLDAVGAVGTLDLIPAERAAELFKIQPSFHSNFPAANLDAPILRLEARDLKGYLQVADDDLRGRLEKLREACARAEVNPKSVASVRRIQKNARELRPRFPTAEVQFAAFDAVLDRIRGSEGGEEAWVRGLAEAALRVAEGNDKVFLDQVKLLVAGKLDLKSGKGGAVKLPVILDVCDVAKFRCRVADPRMGSYYSRQLLGSETNEGAAGICALTGRAGELEDGPLPRPNLPVLGPTSLMSMNPDTPCQTRYGRIGSDVFRVGKRTATELNAAVVLMTAPEWRFKTWQAVPGSAPGKSNLLITYLSGSPLGGPFAALFSEPERAEASYTALCADVAAALSGHESFGSDRLEVLVLNKISPGQAQVELGRSFTAEQVVRGGREWQEAAQSLPELVIRRKPEVPFPAEVVRCTRRAWIRGGKEAVDAGGCGIAQVYDLLVADMPGAPESARALLGLIVKRAGPLMRAMGHAVHRGGKEAWKGFAKDAAECASIAVAVIAIALVKTGVKKEAYMGEPAYHLGRFLSLVDTLHREYCANVRENQIPPQLLGNSLVPTVVANPQRGLAHMLSRIRVYRGWAEKGGSGLARWSVGEMGKLTPRLAERLPDRRLNEGEQAQLLLGYLARAEKKEEKGSDE